MIPDLFSMADQTCLITGGSKGLGRHMADAFLEAGASRVYITARNAEAVEATAAELTQAYDGDCIALTGDLSTMDDVAKTKATRGAGVGGDDVALMQLEKDSVDM